MTALPRSTMIRPAASMLVPAGLAISIFTILGFHPRLFSDGDTGWHLAAGRFILQAGQVPTSDPFSFTRLGAPWVTHEWLAEVLMAALYHVGGWPGLALLFGGAAAGLILLLGREFSRWLPSRRALILLLLVAIVLAPFTLARPHVLAWPILAAWTLLLMRASESGRAPPLLAVLLMLLWANLHGSFLFGLMLIAPFGLEALLATRDRRAVVVGWGSFGIAALIAAVCTPNGIEGILFPLQVSNMDTLSLIIEWRPTSLTRDFSFSIPLLVALVALIMLRVRLPPVRLLLLLALLVMAFLHIRHQAVLAIVGSLLLARPLAQALARGQAMETLVPAIGDHRRRIETALAVALLLVSVVRAAIPMQRVDSASNPARAIAAVPVSLRELPVLNAYNFGGSLIFAGIRPFIDGRADMYGDQFFRAFKTISDGDAPAFQRAVQHWSIRWTMMPPRSPLVTMLDHMPGWHRIYADRWAVVHVRDTGSSDG